MLTYEAPAKAFCDKLHASARMYMGQRPFDKPRDAKTRRTLRLLTSLSSICVRRRNEVIATAVFFDSSNNQRPTLLFAGNTDIPAETRFFVGNVLSRLQDWSAGARLSTLDGRMEALVELVSTIFTFQAERWFQRLYDNDIDNDTLNTRLGQVRACLDHRGQNHAGLESLLTTFEALRGRARTLFSETGLRHELVDSLVDCLIDFQHLLTTEDPISVLEVADYSPYITRDTILDNSRPLVADDVHDLEGNDGHLLPTFFLNRYFANITAIVRYAMHLLTFADNHYGFFDSGGVNLEFCDCVDDSGVTHAAMRILAAIMEWSHGEHVTFISAVGSSAPLCPVCYHCYSTIYTVRGLPPNFPATDCMRWCKEDLGFKPKHRDVINADHVMCERLVLM